MKGKLTFMPLPWARHPWEAIPRTSHNQLQVLYMQKKEERISVD